MTLKIYGWMDPVPADVTHIVPRMRLRTRGRIAEYIKTLKAMPPGMRGIIPWSWPWSHRDDSRDRVGSLTYHPDDRCTDANGNLLGPYLWRHPVLWWTDCLAGIEYCRTEFEWYLERFKDAGVEVDAVINDHESPLGYWDLARGGLEAMQEDPRWPGELVSDDYPEMPLVNLPGQVVRPTTTDGMADPDQAYNVFTAVMHRYYSWAMEQAFYVPLIKFYPNALCMNYWTGRVEKEKMEQYNMPQGPHWQWQESFGHGTHTHCAIYNGWHHAYTDLPWRDGQPVGDSQYIKFLGSIKRAELSEDSSTRPLAVAIGPRSFAHPEYGDDLMRHMLVRGVMPLLFNDSASDASDRHTDQVLAECEMFGVDLGENIHHHVTEWADRFVWSCAKVGDNLLHRISMEFPDKGVRVRIGSVEKNYRPDDSGVGVWITHDASDHFEILGGAKRPVISKPPVTKPRPHLEVQ